MEPDWKQQPVVEAYAKAMWPYGDAWRMALVNPIILQTAQKLCSEHLAAENGESDSSTRKTKTVVPMHVDDLPLDLGLVLQREELSFSSGNGTEVNVTDALRNWHKAKLADPKLEAALINFKILDLGCGEGYLGRLLSKLGAAYLGIDGSEGLLQVAKAGGWNQGKKPTQNKSSARQSKNASEPQFICADLNGASLPTRIANIEKQLKEFGTPDLAIMTIVLDHLQDPQPVLNWVSGMLAEGSDHRALLLFTLNRDYFELDQKRNGHAASQIVKSWVEEGEKIIHFKARIHSAQQPVEVFIRSKRTIERHLREARFRVVQSMPVYFWFGFSHENQPAHIQGIPPFSAFLVRPLPKADVGANIKNILNTHWKDHPSGLLATLSKAQKKALCHSAAQLELIKFKAEQTAIGQHNLGGDLSVVLKGCLELRVNDEPVMSGGPGQIFGDLETGPDGRAAYYPYPMVAGLDGATVLRIPESVTSGLIDKESTFGMSLFRQLRDRLVVWNWINALPTHSGKIVRQDADFNKELAAATAKESKLTITYTDAARVARVLLAAAEEERQFGKRDSEGRAILLDVDKLFDRLHIRLKNQHVQSPILRTLTMLGIVDGFPGDRLRTDFSIQSVTIWNKVVDESANNFFGTFSWSSVTDKNVFTSHVKKLYGTDNVPEWQHIKKKDGLSKKYVVEKVLNYRSELLLLSKRPQMVAENQWKPLVERWYEFLWSANQLFFGGTSHFFVIQDAKALRRLVLDPEKMVNYQVILRHRALTAIKSPAPFLDKKSPSYERLVPQFKGCCEGRIEFYLHRLLDFCLQDLEKANGRLAFSGSHEGFPLPDSWDKATK